jgi:hypothetical protein
LRLRIHGQKQQRIWIWREKPLRQWINGDKYSAAISLHTGEKIPPINHPNLILEKQNQPAQIEYLVAQRSLYSKAKVIHGVEVSLAVPVVVILSLISIILPEILPWVALYGLIVTIIDYSFLEQLQDDLKKKAAQIQELFDCKVLELDWPTWKIPHRPDPENIFAEYANYREKCPDLEPFHDWYPPAVGKLPLTKARIVCQRTNVWYDSSLRHRYASAIAILLGFYCIFIFLIGLSQGLTLEKFILGVVTPLSPALYWGIREYRSQTDAALDLDRLKDYSELLIDEMGKGNPSPQVAAMRSRFFQDEIFEHRKNNPLVFDVIYRLLRPRHENQMNKGAEDLVEELANS